MDYTEFLDELYRSFYSNMFRYAKAALPNIELAEEAVQEAFRIACSKPQDVVNSSSSKGWMLKTLRNVIRDMIYQREKDVKLISAISKIPPEELLTYNEEKVEILYRNHMSDLSFRIIVHSSVYGRSIAEIAKETNLSISAVKKRMERARKKYKKKI